MDIRQSHFLLKERIRTEARHSREAYQVVLRMKKLLPDSLKALKSCHRTGNSAAQAERLALTDPDYQTSIEEYLTIYQQGLESRIQWETHKMLLAARQSLQAFHRSL
ncbi:hypothetical protein [Pseudobacteriovorax antillogorgiicola]|uniref:Uncharacterized protein n=1 Tax=Pseudobacteriovorax antillogorgiicola TaxID=1513793 RepID=A0A1Y6CDI7_9BACT|nr:hypothetical protein [Pseudobacteriovorax antillogorgiicola]TCS49389.1 hypothetical protein EDD56_11569 [Pseudobacteriovorax antillogorgiicola]SMF47203.1 hypothetical protein SAMN06296036_114115 [Pseudobacteriovorax antillogorgiicola]